MKAWDKIYIAVSDWLLRVVTENKRLLVLLFVLNLTYFANLYMTIEYRELVSKDAGLFFIYAVYLLFEVFALTTILHVLPKLFKYCLAALTIIFFCVDSVTLMMYRSLFDKGMFQVILDTNVQEATEYVVEYSSLLATKLICAIPFALLLTLLIKAGVTLIDWLMRRPIRILRCLVLMVVIAEITLVAFIDLNIFLMKNPLSVLRMSFLIPRAVNEIREYREVYNNLDAAQIEITRNDSELPWIVFILGESTNRYHMSLYGYDKPTTPHLQRRLEQDGLIVFTDCISGATETMPSCQCLFTFYDNRGG